MNDAEPEAIQKEPTPFPPEPDTSVSVQSRAAARPKHVQVVTRLLTGQQEWGWM